MKTCYSNRNHAGEHFRHQRDDEMLYTCKGYDEGHGLVYLLDGNWGGSLEHTQGFGCHFGHNSFLDYGAEFMCSEFSPIHEILGFSGLTEKKSIDVDWKWILYQHQASFNSSTLLVSKDRLDRSLAMNGVKTTPEMSISCAALKMPVCPHARRNQPKWVRMVPFGVSNTASAAPPKDSVLYMAAKGHAQVSSLPFRSFSMANEDLMAEGKDVAFGYTSSCSHTFSEKFCLASLLHEDKSIMSEGILLDMLPISDQLTMDLTHEDRLDAIKPSLFESLPSMLHRCNDEKVDIKVCDEGRFERTEEEIEMIGKALCHAQTRARLAEDLAKQTLQENKVLEQLLVREARTTYTYRQRALALELENRLLKLYSHIKLGFCADREKAHDRKVVEPRTRALWRPAEKQHPYQTKEDLLKSGSSREKKSRRRRRISVSSILGFAFVLGLSIAGTGMLIVWSVSWMCF